uniref:Uncharacterized protein n=1 Tax=Anguilla anguilla TaxID=7936 RepID=A0A0E9WG86_ANGAN
MLYTLVTFFKNPSFPHIQDRFEFKSSLTPKIWGLLKSHISLKKRFRIQFLSHLVFVLRKQILLKVRMETEFPNIIIPCSQLWISVNKDTLFRSLKSPLTKGILKKTLTFWKNRR